MRVVLAPREGLGGKDLGSTRAQGGTALSPRWQIVSAGLAKVLPDKEVSSHSPKKLPRPGFDESSFKVWKCWLFKVQGEGKEQRVEVPVSE